MLKIFVGLFLVTLLISCSSSPAHVVLVDKLADKYMARASKEGLYTISYGGALMYNVDMIIIDFEYHKPTTLDQARVLFVRKAHEFLELINNDEKIRPYLSHYPFLPEKFSLGIYFKDQNGNYYTEGNSMAYVMMSKGGMVSYVISDSTKEKYTTLTDFYKESFEEAERIVQQQCNGNSNEIFIKRP